MNAGSKATRIKLVCLDVDGVLTDGGLYYDKIGNALKKFNTQDGLGIKVAQRIGLQFAVITGLDSPAVKARVNELKIKHYVPGELSKTPALDKIRITQGLQWSQICYVGDDMVDLKPMQKVGFAVAVSNAVPAIKEAAHFVTSRCGGNGAVREILDMIIEAKGEWENAWEGWL